MPSIRDHIQQIDKGFAALAKVDGIHEASSETLQDLKAAIAQLGAYALQTVTRYDYWRRTYCSKTQMSESDFDTMTDECIMHEGEPEEACKHLVVTPGGRCANCDKRV